MNYFSYSYHSEEGYVSKPTPAQPFSLEPLRGRDRGRAQGTSGILVIRVTLEHDFHPQASLGCFKGLKSFLQRKPMSD